LSNSFAGGVSLAWRNETCTRLTRYNNLPRTERIAATTADAL
jgi:hypothetical protein